MVGYRDVERWIPAFAGMTEERMTTAGPYAIALPHKGGGSFSVCHSGNPYAVNIP
jgi:hypothetical protein